MAFYKLFTKEDPKYLHKTLGFACVASFLYRYFYVYPRYGNLGLGNDFFSWFTMLLHLALSCSSLIFHVLARRILNKPMIIWEEYRLHAIVFTLRCFSVWCFALFCPDFIRGENAESFLLCALVLAHHVAADYITQRHGTVGQTTVRVKGSESAAMRYAKMFYGFYQFTALGSHLIPTSNLHELGFNTLIAIQSSAFLMTLFRKGLIKWYSHAFWYSACLLLSQYHMARFFDCWFLAKIILCFIVRVRWRVSKYYIWAVFCFVSSPAMEGYGNIQNTQHFKGVMKSLNDMSGSLGVSGLEIPGLDVLEMPKFDLPSLDGNLTGYSAATLAMAMAAAYLVAQRPVVNLPPQDSKAIEKSGKGTAVDDVKKASSPLNSPLSSPLSLTRRM